jgi:UDP-galactopyranose mutase
MAVVNYLSESVPHIRVTEYKHLTGQNPPDQPDLRVSGEYPASIRRVSGG